MPGRYTTWEFIRNQVWRSFSGRRRIFCCYPANLRILPDMFHPSYQHTSYRQQVILLNQSYPCPRCKCGVLEPYGHTETFKCNGCDRGFVPLRGGRFLYPANRMGWKIAPIYWWDGLRWHWQGTTATAAQLAMIVLTFLIPMIALNAAFHFNVWPETPELLNPVLLTVLLGLITLEAIYFLCWDFEFTQRRRTSK